MLTQLNCVYIFKSKLHYRPSNLSGSFNLVPKLSTHQSRSLKCVKWSSEIPNAPCKKPKLTWHATWHHGGKYWQKNLYSLISLTLSNLSHPLPSLSLSPISLALSNLSRTLPLLSLSLSLIFTPWAPSLPPPPAGHCAPRHHRLQRKVRHSRR